MKIVMNLKANLGIGSNSKEISKNSQILKENALKESSGEIRDLSFTKAKVLIITSTRSKAFSLISDLLKISQMENSVQEIKNKKRFIKEYYTPDLDSQQDLSFPDSTLESVNDDDCFKIGVKFGKKEVRLYSDFYNSDLVIGSPLGLKVTSKKENYDFLSGIEIMMVDSAHELLMQNWEHTLNIFSNLNLIPKMDHGVDFSRIKEYVLDGLAKYTRQNFILTEYMTPELVNLLNTYCFNIQGILCLLMKKEK